LTVTHPTPGREPETVDLALSADDVARLHDLGWSSRLARGWFDPLYTTLSAHGNPFRAAIMGFEETYKVAVMTYLTIDRLVRGSVGVEQIRGPVGIVHVGTQVADRGFTYLIFFLGIISVNLAVINFLPMPIVDGGLFLFLIYEKFKGRPPSLAFQNAAAIAGVALIATALLVVTWNDLMRLVG
jgi:regulator of sigma E protease